MLYLNDPFPWWRVVWTGGAVRSWKVVRTGLGVRWRSGRVVRTGRVAKTGRGVRWRSVKAERTGRAVRLRSCRIRCVGWDGDGLGGAVRWQSWIWKVFRTGRAVRWRSGRVGRRHLNKSIY